MAHNTELIIELIPSPLDRLLICLKVTNICPLWEVGRRRLLCSVPQLQTKRQAQEPSDSLRPELLIPENNFTSCLSLWSFWVPTFLPSYLPTTDLASRKLWFSPLSSSYSSLDWKNHRKDRIIALKALKSLQNHLNR